MERSQRRVLEAAAVAAVLAGVPSTAHAFARTRSLRASASYLRDATSSIGVLAPPFRPGMVQGAVAHVVISVLAAEILALVLPRRGSAAWGAVAGLVMGSFNVVVVGRRIPAIARLPLGPQLADNVAFGVIFASAVDRK